MIQTHLSDALVLERHINLPLKRQLQMDDAAKFSEAATLISNLKVHNERHILGLETQFQIGYWF